VGVSRSALCPPHLDDARFDHDAASLEPAARIGIDAPATFSGKALHDLRAAAASVEASAPDHSAAGLHGPQPYPARVAALLGDMPHHPLGERQHGLRCTSTLVTYLAELWSEAEIKIIVVAHATTIRARWLRSKPTWNEVRDVVAATNKAHVRTSWFSLKGPI
jgi:hypothetical protein